MEDQCSPLGWAYCFQDEGIEELKHSLLYTSLELETTILSAREELAKKDDEIVHLKVLLTKTSKERDEAITKCQRLMLEKLFFQQQFQQQKLHNFDQIEAANTTTTSNELDHEPKRADSNSAGISISSSDCDENVIASPQSDPLGDVTEKLIVPKKPLPEKGKFLQAIMEAGPLLQTLLLAGPLPQWQHPPPQLSSIDIPPVTISNSPSPQNLLLHHQDSCLSTSTTTSCFSKKRGLIVNSINYHEAAGTDDSSPNYKYQRVVHQSSLTNI